MDLLPVCPACGSVGNMAELDVVPALANISCIDSHTDELTWVGESEIDWNEQRPFADPPEFTCRSCGEICSQAELLAATKKANKEA